MCDGFVQAGCRVMLIARRGADDGGMTPATFYGTSSEADLQFVAQYPTPAGRLLYSYTAATRAREAGANWAFGRDLVGCYFAARLGLPVAFETHSPAALLTGVKRRMFARLIRSEAFRRLVVITQPLKAGYEQTFGLTADQILVLPDAASEPAAHVRALAASDRLSVGYVGHLYAGKGVELIATLAAVCDWADFHIVGGREEDLRFWRDRCRAHPHVHFHGFVPHGLLDAYLASFDLVLAPFQHRITVEGKGDIANFTSPLKLFEYMAAKKAIVCSDLPVLREVMRHEDNCLLVSPADVAAWAASMARLRDDRGLATRLSERAYRDFLQHHTWRARADRVLAALRSRSEVGR
jgi:glycosyltransferase involved in cell wall biosynthesis